MTLNPDNIRNTLQSAGRIISDQKELERIRGERFNIFSILNMETRENETHSAFISELLNPEGSHLHEDRYLKLFLKEINSEDHLDSKSTTVEVEHSIGKRNIESAEGGRIDIYLKDDHGHSISIENKIHAGDQEKQVERYVNYRKATNKVYYLTLWGIEAPNFSSGNYEEGKDYFAISYKDHIVRWLEACQQAAVEVPILRETIKQYLILIKKLTHQLSKTMQEKLDELLMTNYDSAKAIAERVPSLIESIVLRFIRGIAKELENRLDSQFEISLDDDLGGSWKGISIRSRDWNDGILIKLEGSKSLIYNHSIYGVAANKNKLNRALIHAACSDIQILHGSTSQIEWWAYTKEIFNLGNHDQLKRLFKGGSRMEFQNETVDKLVALVKACEEPLSQDFRIK